MCGGDLIVRIESVGSPHVGGGRGFLQQIADLNLYTWCLIIFNCLVHFRVVYVASLRLDRSSIGLLGGGFLVLGQPAVSHCRGQHASRGER